MSILGLSAGDMAAFGMVGLTAIALYTRRRAGDLGQAAKNATRDAVISVKVEGLDETLRELRDVMRSLDRRQDTHELECAEFRGGVIAQLKQAADERTVTGRSVEYVKAQVAHLTPAADTFVEVVAPRRKRPSTA